MFLFILLFILVSNCLTAQLWESSIVYYNDQNRLEYKRDGEGNKVPDFSYAGYKNGNENIPDIKVLKTISPIEGDNTNHINSAILEVSLFNQFDQNGFKGAVLLEAGQYDIHGTINLKSSGVILRGVGDGADRESNSVLFAKGNTPNQRSVMIIGGGDLTAWKREVANSRSLIISDTIHVGEFSFEVDKPELYNVGDNIIIYHPCTEEWLETIDYGGTYSDSPAAEPGVDVPWEVGSQPIVFNRNITKIQDNTITIDVPVFNHLIRELSQSYIYKYNSSRIKKNIGIENLRLEIENTGNAGNENHAWNAFDFKQIEDAWAKNCTASGFGLSGFRTSTATRITIEDCEAIDPVSSIDGGRRYNFNVYTASQQILFKNCIATQGRHSYVSNGTSWTSGIVFYNCTSEDAYAASEGHRRWSMGILWDNHREIDEPWLGYNPRRLGLYNRGYYGTSHGWSIAHSVVWNCDVKGGQIIVQKPPTAQNYSIGSFGSLVAGYGDSSFDEPEGHIEGSNQTGLFPASLYLAQLEERSVITDVQDDFAKNQINEITLKQNYPNPFNPKTKIDFSIVEKGIYTMKVYDILGREIEELLNSELSAGRHVVSFDASDLSSGVYIYSLAGQSFVLNKKMILLK